MFGNSAPPAFALLAALFAGALVLAGSSVTPATAGGTPEASTVTEADLPAALRDYASWRQISPEGYTVPAALAADCAPFTATDAEKPGSHGPDATVAVRVFVNPLAAAALSSTDPFPPGAVIVEEKIANPALGIAAGHGVMTKLATGANPATGDWDFSYFPAMPGDSTAHCAACHRQAPRDFLFAPYLGQSSSWQTAE